MARLYGFLETNLWAPTATLGRVEQVPVAGDMHFWPLLRLAWLQSKLRLHGAKSRQVPRCPVSPWLCCTAGPLSSPTPSLFLCTAANNLLWTAILSLLGPRVLKLSLLLSLSFSSPLAVRSPLAWWPSAAGTGVVWHLTLAWHCPRLSFPWGTEGGPRRDRCLHAEAGHAAGRHFAVAPASAGQERAASLEPR